LRHRAKAIHRRQHIVKRRALRRVGAEDIPKTWNAEAAFRQGVQGGVDAACEHGANLRLKPSPYVPHMFLRKSSPFCARVCKLARLLT